MRSRRLGGMRGGATKRCTGWQQLRPGQIWRRPLHLLLDRQGRLREVQR